jgi:hypothetical protein
MVMRTFQIVRVPDGLGWAWVVVATNSDGGQSLYSPMYETEAEAETEAARLTAADGRSVPPNPADLA